MSGAEYRIRISQIGSASNFLVTGDCRGAEYLRIHPEGQPRAEATLALLGNSALAGSEQTPPVIEA